MHTPETVPARISETATAMAALVVKDGLALGGLGDHARAMLLGLVWAGLPQQVLTEPQLNARLKAQLDNAARCIDTDHVELRRWLCDAGWVQRDAWGREYRRVAPSALPAHLQALGIELAEILGPGDPSSWVQGLRDARQAARAARRQAHERRAAVPSVVAR